MTLGDMADALRDQAVDAPSAGLNRNASISAITYDSRRVVPGSVFVALKGLRADGGAFAEQAAQRGAMAIVSESARPDPISVPWLTVRDARLALALLADRFFDHPSRRMPVIGVTGTNGKTTTAYLLASILDAAGLRAGMLGTVAYRIGGEDREASRTTPEAPDVQQLLSEMLEQGCRSAVMEVSSHALSLKRVDGMRFAAGVFSNLTRDHLDFHEDMEAYFAAKRRLFEMLPADRSRRDQHGRSARARARRDLPASGHLRDQRRRRCDARTDRDDAVRAPLRREDAEGIGAHHVEAGRPPERLQHPRGHGDRDLARSFRSARSKPASPVCPACPGRFEVVSGSGDDVTVVVDYAHTDDALRNLLETARPLSAKRLITVFGCGGDRDRSKRPLMGMVAARLSDVVVITSDNPRSEDPARIIEEIERGIPAGSQASSRAPIVESVVDRAAAIERAVAMAAAGDVVLIAGKGHEKYQQIGDRVLPFDDGEVARAALVADGTDSADADAVVGGSERTNTAGRGNDRGGDERPAGHR